MTVMTLRQISAALIVQGEQIAKLQAELRDLQGALDLANEALTAVGVYEAHAGETTAATRPGSTPLDVTRQILTAERNPNDAY